MRAVVLSEQTFDIATPNAGRVCAAVAQVLRFRVIASRGMGKTLQQASVCGSAHDSRSRVRMGVARWTRAHLGHGQDTVRMTRVGRRAPLHVAFPGVLAKPRSGRAHEMRFAPHREQECGVVLRRVTSISSAGIVVSATSRGLLCAGAAAPLGASPAQ